MTIADLQNKYFLFTELEKSFMYPVFRWVALGSLSRTHSYYPYQRALPISYVKEFLVKWFGMYTGFPETTYTDSINFIRSEGDPWTRDRVIQILQGEQPGKRFVSGESLNYIDKRYLNIYELVKTSVTTWENQFTPIYNVFNSKGMNFNIQASMPDSMWPDNVYKVFKGYGIGEGWDQELINEIHSVIDNYPVLSALAVLNLYCYFDIYVAFYNSIPRVIQDDGGGWRGNYPQWFSKRLVDAGNPPMLPYWTNGEAVDPFPGFYSRDSYGYPKNRRDDWKVWSANAEKAKLSMTFINQNIDTLAGKVRAVDHYGPEIFAHLNNFETESVQRISTFALNNDAQILDASRQAILLKREAELKVIDYKISYQQNLDLQKNQYFSLAYDLNTMEL